MISQIGRLSQGDLKSRIKKLNGLFEKSRVAFEALASQRG
jgi:hypothetical protein